MLEAMLNSWKAEVPFQYVRLCASFEKQCTRNDYADILVAVGRVLERWAADSALLSDTHSAVPIRSSLPIIDVKIYDWQAWEVWWRAHIKGCFPTFAKSEALKILYGTREWFYEHLFL